MLHTDANFFLEKIGILKKYEVDELHWGPGLLETIYMCVRIRVTIGLGLVLYYYYSLYVRAISMLGAISPPPPPNFFKNYFIFCISIKNFKYLAIKNRSFPPQMFELVQLCS